MYRYDKCYKFNIIKYIKYYTVTISLKKKILFFNTNSLKQLIVTLRLETRKKNNACIKYLILYLFYKLQN